jgi:hypothetical protein
LEERLGLLRAGNQDRGWKLSRYIFGQFGCIKGTYNATELPLLLKREEACGDYNKSAAPAKLANVTAFCERQFSRRQSCRRFPLERFFKLRLGSFLFFHVSAENKRKLLSPMLCETVGGTKHSPRATRPEVSGHEKVCAV